MSGSLEALRPRRNEELKTYLARLGPGLVTTLEQALGERRPMTGELVAEIGGRLVLLDVDLVPASDSGSCSLFLSVAAESSSSTRSLFEALLTLERRVGLTTAILSELNQDRDLKEALRRTLPLLLQTLNVETAAVFVVRDARTAELVAIHGPTQKRGYPYQDLALNDSALAPLTRRIEPVQLNPDDTLQQPLRDVMRRGFRLGLLAPIMAGHSVAGYLVISSAHASVMPLDAAAILTMVCEALGPVIQTSAMSEESQRDAAVLHSSQAVFQAISQSLELDQTYQEIAINAASAVSGSRCLLLELQPESGDLVTVAASEADASILIGLHVRFRSGEDLAEVLRNKRSVLVDDLVVGANVSAEARKLLNLRSALIVPVSAQGELIGSLILYSVGRRMRYSDRDMARAEGVAGQAAIAIHNARLYRDLVRSQASIETMAKRISEIRQDERQMFANVVHDDIVQSIVGARYLLESFRRGQSRQSPELLDEAVGVLQQTVIDARRIIWELRPPVLDELGLEASLSALGHHLDGGSGSAEVHSQIDPIPLLNWDTATAIYKVAREATLNARRHASAHNIWLTLIQMDVGQEPSIQLIVRDDGIGFDPSTMRKDDHFGCSMMEEQATIVAGHLELKSTPTSGTSVTLTVPLKQATVDAPQTRAPWTDQFAS